MRQSQMSNKTATVFMMVMMMKTLCNAAQKYSAVVKPSHLLDHMNHKCEETAYDACTVMFCVL